MGLCKGLGGVNDALPWRVKYSTLKSAQHWHRSASMPLLHTQDHEMHPAAVYSQVSSGLGRKLLLHDAAPAPVISNAYP